jgi:transposase
MCLFIDADPKLINRIANGRIGIDPGFKNLLTTSDGEVISHPREFEKYSLRLAQAQRGNDLVLAARIQERIANRRKDRNHKLSRKLVENNIFIAFSKDRIRGISSQFGKSVISSGHAQLRGYISYKSRLGGTEYVEPDSKYSTMTCSECGARSGPHGWAGLKVRRWECACGAKHDRDVNAARVTLQFAAVGTTVERVQ